MSPMRFHLSVSQGGNIYYSQLDSSLARDMWPISLLPDVGTVSKYGVCSHFDCSVLLESQEVGGTGGSLGPDPLRHPPPPPPRIWSESAGPWAPKAP